MPLTLPVKLDKWLLALGVTAWVALVLITANVQDDAYISFRVADNAAHGFGLRWNLYDRVQTYTNPLWMMLHIPFAFFTHDLFLPTIFLGTAFSALAVWFLLRLNDIPPLLKLCFLVLPLFALKAVVFFANSGLENSLNYFLLSLFAYRLACPKEEYRCRDVSLIIALAGINRLDMLLLFGLPFLILLALRRIPFSIPQMLLGGLPLALWLAFATFYYGTPLPNTYYAKLPYSNIPLYLEWKGVRYLQNYCVQDPAGFSMMILALPLAVIAWLRYRKSGLRSDAVCFALGSGVAVFIGYIVLIGGDYLAGRFWSVPTFAAALCLALSLQGGWSAWRRRLYGLLASAVCVWSGFSILFQQNDLLRRWSDDHYPASLGYLWFWPMPHEGNTEVNTLIGEDGTIRWGTNRNIPLYQQVMAGYESTRPVIWGALGFSGYFGNPHVIRIDPMALSDAFMARLPPFQIGIGHMKRRIPKGYLKSLATGSLTAMDPDLVEYYKPLQLIISGPLFSMERLKTLVKFQLGYYDHYRDLYIACHNTALQE